jgi:ABC-2 type transport system ATP-binding protein
MCPAPCGGTLSATTEENMHAVEVDNLIKKYDDRLVLKGVSFTVAPGEIFGILGPNGAGKTTTVESIVGLRRPDGGTIRILGLDPQKDRDQVRKRVGVQLQEARLTDRLKVWEALDLYSSFYETPVSWRELADRLGGRQVPIPAPGTSR